MLLWFWYGAFYIVIFTLFKTQLIVWQHTLLCCLMLFYTEITYAVIMFLLQDCNASIFLLVSSVWMNLVLTVSWCPEMLYNRRAAALTSDGPCFCDALPLNAIRAQVSAETGRENKGKKWKESDRKSLHLPGQFIWLNSISWAKISKITTR